MAGRRSGFVAAVAVYLLTVIAGLAAASFYAVTEARRAANRLTRQEEAASAADVGLHAVLTGWGAAGRDSVPIGRVDSSAAALEAHGGLVFVSVIRLTKSTYWIGSTGRMAVGTSVEATRTHNLLVEVLTPAFPDLAALIARGDVVSSADFIVDADDTTPPGWTGCPAADTADAPAVAVPDGRSATFVDGRPMPDVHSDSTVSMVAAARRFGRVDAQALAARATLVLPPGALLAPSPDLPADCRYAPGKGPLANWGEPVRTGRSEGCERFFPVIHALGDLTLTGGRGQGVLLVAGRLRVEGPFVFHGVIVAADGIDVTGRDVSIYGAVAGSGEAPVTLRAAGLLRRSTCAVDRVSSAASRAYPVPHRAWAELF